MREIRVDGKETVYDNNGNPLLRVKVAKGPNGERLEGRASNAPPRPKVRATPPGPVPSAGAFVPVFVGQEGEWHGVPVQVQHIDMEQQLIVLRVQGGTLKGEVDNGD